jgi:enterochelin esterase-like enzyme
MKKSKIERITICSNSLGKEMSVLVYLPKDYDETDYFPTLYFHHGRSGDENILTDADIHITADKLIENKQINPLIIVCPNLENSRGLNSSSACKEVKDPLGRVINMGKYEDYFINEVIPIIDNKFKTINNRNNRFIGGASAGGYIALHNAFRHPDLFSKVGGHMPALELKLEEEDKAYFQCQANWDKYDPIKIAQQMKCTDFKVYLDAGDNDEGGFYEGCSILNKILKEKGIDSQNHVFEGHHDLKYIKSNLEKYLIFYGNTKPTVQSSRLPHQ